MMSCILTSFRLLTAVARVFSKFPTNQDAVLLAMQTVPYFKDGLPENAPAILTEVQMNAFEAFSQLDIEENSNLLKTAMNFIVILWVFYPTTLPAACNIKQLARLVNCALTPEPNGQPRKEEAIECGNVCVSYLMRVLSDSQVNALEAEGVCDKLGALLVYFDEMPEQTLQQIIIGVGIFAEVKGGSLSCLDESLCTSLLFAAQKYVSNSALQELIWRLMSLFCQRNRQVAQILFQLNVIDAMVSIMKKTDTSFLPLLRFLMVTCHLSGHQYIPGCLGSSELIEVLTDVIKREPSSPNFSLEVLASTCDFISLLCSKCEPQALSKLIELDLVSQLESAARHSPQACLLPACISIEGTVNVLFPDVPAKKNEVSASHRKNFYDQNHHLFVKDMLSNPLVYENPAFVELMYVTFQKILKACGVERLEEMCSKEFLEFFVISFIRDTMSLSSQANRIVFTAHYFVFQMKKKEIIEILRELDFHTAVVELVSMSESYELMSTAMGLLACLMGKYYEYLKDVKPFLKAQVPDTLLKKVKLYGMSRRTHFGEDFSRILLNLTADKDLSLELYNQGFLDQLTEQVKVDYIDLVKRAMIHAIGNIALCGQNVKQVLLDRKVYETLLKTLSSNLKKGDPFLLSACCRVLHILASGDWAKRKFVESGCVEVLLNMLKTRHDNPEVCWRPLGLLSSLGFMAVLNRRFVLTCDVVETVVKILAESTNGKVTSYTTLVFLGSGELDEGSVKLRELAVNEHLHKAMKNADFLKQAPDLERWSVHVLEKLDLHTVVLPAHILSSLSPPTLCHISDWPPFVQIDTTAMEVESPSSQKTTRKLLPLQDDYLYSHTPVAIELSDTAKDQLTKLGLNPGEPLFRIGRVYGSTFGLCSNCEKEGTSEELVIRPQSMTPHQYQHLIDNGWYRRGGVKMFRLRYNHNVHCCDWETRVSVHDFDHRTHKSYKKVLKRMPDERLKIVTKPTHFSREAFDLYNDYHIQRHEKPWKSEYSYCEHIVNSPVEVQTIEDLSYGTHHQLYYLDDKLVAIGVIDIVPKGIVSIYMWYNVSKEVSKLSFGVYSALKEIDFVREMSKRNPSMKYYYLQGWNSGNKKLSYKANYEPEDFYCPCIVESWVSGLESVTTAKDEAITRLKPAEVKQEEVSPDVKDESQSAGAKSTSNDQSESSTDKKGAEEEKKKENEDHSDDIKKVEEGKKKNDEQESEDKASEGTDGGEEAKQEGAVNKSEQNSDSKPDESKKEDKKPSEPAVPCEAFPNDLERYKQLTGQSTVDVSKIVVCLNYTQYMYLGELFEQFEISTEQRTIMEKRFRETVVAIGPELTSQLVIDLKACPMSENMQVEESANSVVKN